MVAADIPVRPVVPEVDGVVEVDEVLLEPCVTLVRTNLVVVSAVVVVPEVPVAVCSARARQPVIVTLSVELALVLVGVVVVCAANVVARAIAIAAHAPVQNFWYIVPSLM